MIRLSGRFRSALVIGMQGIRARKLRTLLSMISLFLGVLAVVVVQAGAEVAHRALLADVELTQGKDGTRMLFMPPDPKVIHTTVDALRDRPDGVALLESHAVIGEPGVRPVNPDGIGFDHLDPGAAFAPQGRPAIVCDGNGACAVRTEGPDAGVQPAGQAIALDLIGLTGDVRQFRPFRPVSGQWLDFASAPSLAPRLVLNREAAKGFNRFRVPAEMRLDGASLDPTPRILGVVDDGSDQPRAYLRADELLTWLPDTALGQQGPGLQVLLGPAADDTQRILVSRLTAGGVPAAELHLETINATARLSQQLALTRWVFLGLAGLVLLIGVAGILNVGLATVGERIEEFALRRAVGTPRSLLAAIVLAETLLTGLLTAAAAIGTAAVVLRLVGAVVGSRQPVLQHLQFPWQAGVAGIIAGLVAGLLGGFIPALRAARIPIATIMRA